MRLLPLVPYITICFLDKATAQTIKLVVSIDREAALPASTISPSTLKKVFDYAFSYRRLRADRRRPDGRARRARRFRRLVVLASVRRAGLLCRTARHARARPVADRASGRHRAGTAPLSR